MASVQIGFPTPLPFLFYFIYRYLFRGMGTKARKLETTAAKKRA